MNFKLSKEKGFSILAVILVIVAVIVAIGIWSLSGQSNSSTASDKTVDVQISGILNDANAIKLAFDNLIINGASSSSIVFTPNVASTASAPNVLDPINGITLPKVNPNLIRDGATEPEGIWVYRNNIVPPSGVGTGVPTSIILLAGVKDTICQKMVSNLYNNPITPYRSGTAGSSVLVLGATYANPNSTQTNMMFSGSGNNSSSGRTLGCIRASAGGVDNNIIYQILAIK